MTQRELVRFGGTEVFTVEVAKALSRRGHEVAVYTQYVHDFGMRVYSDGVITRSQLKDIPFEPDIIHAQHHLPAITALTHFSKVPGIYMCHGAVPWTEMPPPHPRIRRYVMMCEWLIQKSVAQFNLPKERTTYIHNHVDTKRFTAIKPVPPKPKRACFYGHDGFSPQEIESVTAACEAHGMTLEFLGVKWGRAVVKPELELQGYDLVFAIGKCAFEAISCGCAVIPIIPNQAASLVTMENFESYLKTNLGAILYTSSDLLDEKWLGRQLEKFHPDEVLNVTHHLREHCTLEKTVDQLLAIYESVLAEPPVEALPDDAAPYLESIWADLENLAYKHMKSEEKNRKLQHEVGSLNDQIRTLQVKVASLTQMEQHVESLKVQAQDMQKIYEETLQMHGNTVHLYHETKTQLVKAQTENKQWQKESSATKKAWQQMERYFEKRFFGKWVLNKISRYKPHF